MLVACDQIFLQISKTDFKSLFIFIDVAMATARNGTYRVRQLTIKKAKFVLLIAAIFDDQKSR